MMLCDPFSQDAANHTTMIRYDIDEIIAASPNDMEVADTLELNFKNVPREELYPEERVVIDAWKFDYCMGNQLQTMVDHQQFDEIVNGFAALLNLDDPFLHEFVASMRTALKSNGIDPSTPEGFSPIADLEDSARESLEAEIDRAEAPYLSRIWGGAIPESFGRYLRSNINVFRSRNA